jgi:hypothetical protein
MSIAAAATCYYIPDTSLSCARGCLALVVTDPAGALLDRRVGEPAAAAQHRS